MSASFRTAKLLLLAGTCISAAPVMAQDTDIDARLDRLESMVAALIERMDRQDAEVSEQDSAIARQAQQAVQETRQLAARTEEVEKKVAENSEPQSGFTVGKTRVTYNGYVKIDAISQRFSGGEVEGGSIVRDFLIPGAIPVGGSPSGFNTDFNARETRFFLETATDIGEGHTLGSKIELDFMVTPGGDERISNSFQPRLRQAYITYDNWLFGQTWSTFQDVGALPEALDFIGPTPGTVFDRQPMVRYTKGGWQFALEQPETTVTSPTGARVVTGDDTLPDVVVRYNHKGDFGHLTAAAIGRVLRVEPDDFGQITDNAYGYGLSLSGKLNVGPKDDFRFMATAGQGLGRYIGLNIVNDAALRTDGSLQTIATYSGFAAYRHYWASNIRSTVSGSYFKADNPVALTTGDVTDESWNVLGNLIWSPFAPIDFGIEYMFANRETEIGEAGNLQRVQVSATYRF